MLKATSFAARVYRALLRVPRGRVTTYKRLARMMGSPKSYRAVGNALNRNPDAPHVPCHRVIASDGSLGGYAGGLKKKVAMLKREGVKVMGKRINLKKFGFGK